MAGEAQYELCPHEGSIVLAFDAGFGVWMLGHKVTQQVRPLPPPNGDGVWCLVNDDSGECYVDDGETSRWVYEFLDQDVWIRLEDGVRVVRGPTGEMTVERRLTTNLKCLATLALGPSRTLVSFAFAIFFARSGCRCWWNLFDLYRGLGLSGKNGNGPRWVQSLWPSMDRLRILLGLQEPHLRRSSTIGATDGEDLDRVLLYPSVSTHMLVALCTRWSSLDRALGGLGSDREQRSVSDFLEELVNLVGRRLPTIVLRVSADAAWDPPLPVLGEACVSLSWVGGRVDIAGLRESLRRLQLGGNRTAGDFLNALVGFPHPCCLQDMLANAATQRGVQVAMGLYEWGRGPPREVTA